MKSFFLFFFSCGYSFCYFAFYFLLFLAIFCYFSGSHTHAYEALDVYSCLFFFPIEFISNAI